MKQPQTRREILVGGATIAGAVVLGQLQTNQDGMSHAQTVRPSFSTAKVSAMNQVRYCLNTSTIRGQQLPLADIIDLAAEVGYDSIEPWISELDAVREKGGTLADIAKRLSDRGLRVESVIGFANWIVDDAGARAKGLEVLRRDMDMAREIGSERIAAPPAGAEHAIDLAHMADRYRAILELGAKHAVIPQLELWGFSPCLSRLGQLLFVASESGHPDACVLPDIYHIYKGGSDFQGLKLINGSRIHVFHMNDYPAIPRDQITDADRVFPGGGIAPLKDILTILLQDHFAGALSLELFNRTYWQHDAKDVLRDGLQAMQVAVRSAL